MHKHPFFSEIIKDPAKGFQFFSICRQGVALAVGVVLAKSYFSLVEIGIYEIWMFLGAIISFLWLSGSFQAFTTFYARLKVQDQKKAVFNTYLVLSLITMLILVVLWSGKKAMIPWLTGQSSIPGIEMLICFLWLHLIAFFTPYIFLVHERASHFLPYSIFYSIGYILAVALPVLWGKQLTGILQSLLFFAFVEHVLLWIVIIRSSSLKLDLSLIKRFIILALPLALYAAIGSFAYIFDAWLVNWFYQKPEVFAIFKFGARELPGALALAGAFSIAMIPMIVQNQAGGLARIKSGSEKLIHLFFPISMVLMIVSPWLFKWIYNENFIASAQIFNMYLLLMISRFVFPNSILIALQKSKILVGISLIELILNIGLSVLLIETMGLLGVALATVIAYFLEKVLLVMYIKRKENIPFSSYTPTKWWAIYSVGLIIAFLIGSFWVGP